LNSLYLMFAAAVFLVVCYTGLRSSLSECKLITWFDRLIAVFFSVSLAVFVGWHSYENRLELQDTRERSTYNDPLAAELALNLCFLQEQSKDTWLFEYPARDSVLLVAVPLEYDFLLDAARSGLFDASMTKLMLLLISEMKEFNGKTELTKQIHTRGPVNSSIDQYRQWKKYVKTLADDLERKEPRLKRKLRLVAKDLGIESNYSIECGDITVKLDSGA